jgi:hypothetical protein
MRTSSASEIIVSRRTVLLCGLAGGASALTTGASALTMSPVKVSKDSVRYQNVGAIGRECGQCKLFVKPYACIAVEGEIHPGCTCRIWLPKSV